MAISKLSELLNFASTEDACSATKIFAEHGNALFVDGASKDQIEELMAKLSAYTSDPLGMIGILMMPDDDVSVDCFNKAKSSILSSKEVLVNNQSVCKSFSCPFWSDGVKSEGGAIGNYGCQKYTVAPHCLASNVQGVSATQYELFYDSGLSMNVKTLISLAIAHLVFRQMDDEESRNIAAKRRDRGW